MKRIAFSTLVASALGALAALAAVAAPAALAAAEPAATAPWQVPQIALPARSGKPVLACTPEELARLRAAYRGAGQAHDVVAAAIARADGALVEPVRFPPRGGQHNQWYQCDKCQLALVTLDDTHHQCPRCKTVYSGEPYDDVVFERQHYRNLSDMEAAAWAYAITGQAKYARRAAEVLLGYARRYGEYPYHTAQRTTGSKTGKSGGHLFEQTLNEASAMARQIAPAYDLIYDSDTLSRDEHEAIRRGLIVPMLENIARNRAGKSNWQTWHNAAMLAGGAVLGDQTWVRRAIDDPSCGFAYQMQASVTGDGMWYENSWGYHFYTLGAMVQIVEGARRLGIDLWSHPALKRMFTVAVEYAMPDGSLPRFGDDVSTRVDHASRYLEFAWHAYRDPAMLPYLPGRASWDSVMLGRDIEPRSEAPAPGSKLFPAAGHAVLRAGGPEGLAAVMTFGPYGGFHGHLDKLSFVFFGCGRELGVDPGRARSQAYRLPIHRDWYKATLGHNAVLVDQRPQEPAAGELEFFAADDASAVAVARCDAAYPGTSHRRMLCLKPGYLLVFDQLRSDAPHRYDWTYHNRGSGARCAAAQQAGTLGDDYTGSEYVEHVIVGQSDKTIRVEFADGEATVALTFDAAAGSEVRTGDGVGGSILDRVPMVMVTRRGKDARFAAVLEPVGPGGTARVQDVTVEQASDGLRIVVARGGQEDVVLLGADGRAKPMSLDEQSR